MTLIEIEIDIDRNTRKRFTLSVSEFKNKNGQNVQVFLPQTEEEQRTKVKKDYCGGGYVFYTDGKIKTAKDCQEWELK
jgi:hypothetical protein